MRGVFAVAQPAGERWSIALDLLRSGEAFSLGRITLRRVDARTVEVAVASTWRPENLTEQVAATDLRWAASLVHGLLADDEGFRQAVGASSIDVVLVDDYETGSIALCRLTADGLDWLVSRDS